MSTRWLEAYKRGAGRSPPPRSRHDDLDEPRGAMKPPLCRLAHRAHDRDETLDVSLAARDA
jgi:hypothetical protein